jgi:hypothetical protein
MGLDNEWREAAVSRLYLLTSNLTTAATCEEKMATGFDTAAFERATDPILKFFTPEQARALIAWRGDSEMRAEIDDLAARNTEGQLTESERARYEGYVRANKFIAILQAKARKLIPGS